MGKAILVMDMPKNCAECNLCGNQDDEYFCIPDDFTHYLGSSYVNHSCESRPEWCLLKPMPEKRNTEYNPARNPYTTEGYNTCIDEILGN